MVNYEGEQHICIWQSNTEAGEKWKATYSCALFDIKNTKLILKHTFDFEYYYTDTYPYQEDVLHRNVMPENSAFLKDGKAISYGEFQEIRTSLLNPIKELCSTGMSEKNTGLKLKDYLNN